MVVCLSVGKITQNTGFLGNFQEMLTMATDDDFDGDPDIFLSKKFDQQVLPCFPPNPLTLSLRNVLNTMLNPK